MKLEVVVASLNKPENLIRNMNINTDVVIANQTNFFGFEEYDYKGSKIKIVNTNTIGVGKNRNIGILYVDEDTDIVLFSDDDITYKENYKELVCEAFEVNSKADIIIFELNYFDNTRPSNKKVYKQKYKRLRLFNSLKYGGPRIAIRKDSLSKSNIWFSTLYGGGADFSSGEDSLFLVEAFRKKLVVYKCSNTIADVNESKSTWFEGYNDKYFFDKGIWIANAFPTLKYIMLIYFSVVFGIRTKKSIINIFAKIYEGIISFKNITLK